MCAMMEKLACSTAVVLMFFFVSVCVHVAGKYDRVVVARSPRARVHVRSSWKPGAPPEIERTMRAGGDVRW